MPNFGQPGYRVEAKTVIVPVDYPDLNQEELDAAYEHIRSELHRRLSFEQLRALVGDRELLRLMTAAYDVKEGSARSGEAPDRGEEQ